MYNVRQSLEPLYDGEDQRRIEERVLEDDG